MPVTFECAGNGRALFETRAVSQPWLLEAVGTGEWTGTPLAPLLREAGPPADTVEVLFTGLDRGIEGEQEQAYERSLPLAEAMRDEVLLVYEMNGQPLLPQHGAPLRLLVPGWYGMTNVKWLSRIGALSASARGLPERRELPHPRERRRGRPCRSPACACDRSSCRRASRASPSANACSRPVPSRSRDGHGRARARSSASR